MKLHLLALAAALLWGTFFVASLAAQPLRDELDKRVREELPPPPGSEPPRDAGFLGLFADDAETPGKGVEVISVHPRGPADAAGLKRGDLIIAIDGKPIARIDDMGMAVGGAAVGKRLRIDVQRDGKRSTHILTVVKRPAAPPKLGEDDLPLEAPGKPDPLVEPPVRPGLPPAKIDLGERASLGVRLLPVTDEVRRRHGLVVARGAVIESVREGSAADKFGLPLGGVIVSYDGRRIDSPDDLIAALRGARPGDEVEIGYYQGERMFRKLVRLVPAAAVAPAARGPVGEDPDALPGLPGVPGLADRPAVKKIEGLLDRFLPPAPGEPGVRDPLVRDPLVRDPLVRDPGPPRPGDDRREVAELRSAVESLQAELARLQRKVAELEAKLGEK